MQRYKETVVEPRRELIRSVLRRGIGTGELRPDADVEVAMFMLTGAVVARGKHDAERITAGLRRAGRGRDRCSAWRPR